MKLRVAHGRIAPTALAAVAVAAASTAAALLAAPAATAGPQTKWYTATVGQTASPTTATVLYTLPPSSTQTLYLQIFNDLSSNQSFGSADIDLNFDWGWGPASPMLTTASGDVALGWTAQFDNNNNHLLHLRNSGVGSQYAILPGESLTVTLTFARSTQGIDAPGLVVKQSNDFSDSSTRNTSNVFGTQAPSPEIDVGTGPPAQIVYTQNPSDVQMTSTATGTHFMCPPVTTEIRDRFGNLVTWLPPTAVTLSSTGTPGLELDSSTTLSSSRPGKGVATVGAGNTTTGCSAGLTAANQGTYAMTASTTWAAGTGYATGSASTTAVVYNVSLAQCGASCNVDLPSGNQTDANVSGTNGPSSGDTPLFGSISKAGALPSRCAGASINRPEQTFVLLDNHDKSITLAWSKKVTNLDPRNGTPFWPVCIQGPYSVYVTDGAGGAKPGDATYGALLVLCSTPGVAQRGTGLSPGPALACISSLYKNAASEHAVIWVPDQPGDPHMW